MTVSILGMIACLLGAPAEASVIFVTVDTLRADRLGCYGYPRPTSPFWDELAGESVLFHQAFAQSSFTPPSHASMFTSLYVRDHGLQSWTPLRPDHTTLAEVLRKAGYKTLAVNSLRMLTLQNLGQGFDDGEEKCEDAEEVNRRALAWIRANRDRKFFIWLHYYDVHWPYAPHPDYERMFNPTADVKVGRENDHYNLTPEKRRTLGFTDADVRFIKDRYDAGIVYMDRALRRLVDRLKELGVWDKTLFVLTSDHGESLDDRNIVYFAHDPFLQDEVIRIPLLIRFPHPEFRGREIHHMVESIDLAPTILDYLGIPAPAQFKGRSLLPSLRGREPGRKEVFSECWGQAVRKSIRTDRWKLIWSVVEDKRDLYDLKADPGERTNVADKHPQVAKRLYDRLLEWVGDEADTLQQLPKLSEETIRQLRALGYIGAGGEEQ